MILIVSLIESRKNDYLLSEQVVRLKGAPVERPEHGESTCLVSRALPTSVGSNQVAATKMISLQPRSQTLQPSEYVSQRAARRIYLQLV
jgi:hypothetical protein